MKKRTTILSLLLALLLLGAGWARAEVILRYSPADTTVAAGDTSRLSIMCDDVLDLRTIEVFVQFDPAVVGSVAGGSGSLFTDSGFTLFQGFELTEENVWHGYCVVMGAYDYITTPGELFYWEFEGLVDGVSPIETVSVALAAPDASLIPDVSLPPTTITIGDYLSSVEDLPLMGSDLRCFPNPFNPRTEVSFKVPAAQQVRLGVFDLQGRRVAVLHQGWTEEGLFSEVWNGRDDQGRLQPGGMYLFRLQGPSLNEVAKGLLVK